ncbi:MAG: hypothetical protein Q7T12_00025 [Flavobacterium sp.]|nr:hypothetical protein [Flavobacterium sp.]
MGKRRAILTTGNSVTQIKRGPERDRSETAELKDDLTRLKTAYPPHKAAYFNEGQPLYKGETDEIFDKDL